LFDVKLRATSRERRVTGRLVELPEQQGFQNISSAAGSDPVIGRCKYVRWHSWTSQADV